MGGTPAYAYACTNFTFNRFVSNRNTNQGNDQGCVNFTYQDDPGITLPAGWTWNWGGNQCPGTSISLSGYPADVKCTVNVWLYRSGDNPLTQAYPLSPYEFGPSLPPLNFNLPQNNNLSNQQYANMRFAVQVQCVKVGQEFCLELPS
jgi:hypothetical protein